MTEKKTKTVAQTKQKANTAAALAQSGNENKMEKRIGIRRNCNEKISQESCNRI